MVPEPLIAPHSPVADASIKTAIARRYLESGAQQFDITSEAFEQIVGAVLVRAGGSAEEQLKLIGAAPAPGAGAPVFRGQETVCSLRSSAEGELPW